MRARISSKSAAPFLGPKLSHASHAGSTLKLAKYPKPAIALCGDLRRKKKGRAAAHGRISPAIGAYGECSAGV